MAAFGMLSVYAFFEFTKDFQFLQAPFLTLHTAILELHIQHTVPHDNLTSNYITGSITLQHDHLFIAIISLERLDYLLLLF